MQSDKEVSVAPSQAPVITPRYLNERQAAAYLGVSPNLLEKMRRHGGGPAFIKGVIGVGGKGVVRYDREDLDAWCAGRKVRSTSEYGARVQREKREAAKRGGGK